MDEKFTIRRLTHLDEAQFRLLRLEGLREHPVFFGYSFEEEVIEPPSFFVDRLSRDVVFGILEGEELLGVAALAKGQLMKTRHKGTIWGIYLKPDLRGQGVARRLLEALIDEAKHTVSELRLTVSTENVAAYRLYLGLGFQTYGREPRALKIGDTFHDEFLMELKLPQPASS